MMQLPVLILVPSSSGDVVKSKNISLHAVLSFVFGVLCHMNCVKLNPHM